MVNYALKQFKSILNKRKFIDSWFWDRYGINAYQGCQFGCIYCDSRSARYHLPIDFENDIIVKKNVGVMLDKRLSNARTLIPDVVGLAAASDPYQPAESKFKNTRQCLEVLNKHKYPVHIITKSKLVLRDLELLDQIGKNNWCCVSQTITTTNRNIAKFGTILWALMLMAVSLVSIHTNRNCNGSFLVEQNISSHNHNVGTLTVLAYE